jgi:hypothetical protein
MFGFLFSLKQLVQKLAPRGASGGFHTCSTSTYKLNYFETLSGFRFVLCTDLRAGARTMQGSSLLLHPLEARRDSLAGLVTPSLCPGDMREALRHIYADIFVEHLTKNPLWVVQEPISCTAFVRDLDAYLGSLAQ